MVSGQQQAPAALYPRERPVPILQDAEWRLIIFSISLHLPLVVSICSSVCSSKAALKLYTINNKSHNYVSVYINRLTPNDSYMGRTAPLTSKRFILYIYSTNIGTEYFKHALYSPFFLFKMQFVS